VVVRGNDMGGEDGIALGSEMSGDIRYVFFTDNVLRSGSSAIRFKANLDRGGRSSTWGSGRFTVGSFARLFWFQLDYPGELGGNFPSTYRDIAFEELSPWRTSARCSKLTRPREHPSEAWSCATSPSPREADLDPRERQDLQFHGVTVAGRPVSVPAGVQ